MTALQIEAEALAARLAAGDRPFILDVREPWEFDLCRLDGAVNIPLGQLTSAFDPAAVAEGQDIVVVCHHGMRSLQATMWLRRQGIDTAINLSGGVDRWAQVVAPEMARY
ncbi:rhodanese-like domain-containing protein [Zavarzinia aquatilis]|uniref:Sulfurtransferase n=1 Tax=Zavarzinia aquatilis TaxID=2211142 RepID=A0A317EH50_9PROT|nr:rhodanese-like domain-containing protein [Zavarzinia aquatilis]PWR25596.1 sulfurtransferase [Zavarzinia aquatilis]